MQVNKNARNQASQKHKREEVNSIGNKEMQELLQLRNPYGKQTNWKNAYKWGTNKSSNQNERTQVGEKFWKEK